MDFLFVLRASCWFFVVMLFLVTSNSSMTTQAFLRTLSCRNQQLARVPTRQRVSPTLWINIDDVISDDSSSLWVIRGCSAVISYLGFVAYLDRPRGILNAHRQLEIKTSTVAGLGLFATENIQQGTILGTYPGVVLPLTHNIDKLAQYPQCEAYIWRFTDNKMVIDPTDARGNLQSVCRGGNPSMPGSMWLFQHVFSFRVSTELCRINEPPKGKDVNVVTEEDCTKRTVTFQAERDILPGEELFIDYGLTYDRSRYGPIN